MYVYAPGLEAAAPTVFMVWLRAWLSSTDRYATGKWCCTCIVVQPSTKTLIVLLLLIMTLTSSYLGVNDSYFCSSNGCASSKERDICPVLLRCVTCCIVPLLAPTAGCVVPLIQFYATTFTCAVGIAM
jgi:hypothetical protein